MLRFNKLRLSGFKSFVDNSELLIELGLTGVVGPNGCGKSNLVEALRWVMGETSAKQMRGGEMDDVIFGGTSSRAPRNVAEVVLCLDNSERSAPAQFNDVGELDVSRRIERDKGSTYRVNGKEVRARDVQLLFADSSTGARSTALVSQGRIGALINAKPTERRGLLEEAAGITGLHSRRHEAELRLRGAETNMERLDDILLTLDAQLTGLKKQARQATRYRNLSDHIRKAEAALFHIRWSQAEAELAAASATLSKTETAVHELTSFASTATVTQAERADRVPGLRQTEAAAAAELHRLTVANQNLEEEGRRIAATTEETRSRLAQTSADMERERGLSVDAERAVERLAGERADIEAAREGEGSARETAATALSEANRLVEMTDAQLTELTEKVAAAEARRNSLATRIRELESRLERLRTRRREIDEQRRKLDAESPHAGAVTTAEDTLKSAETTMEAARQAQAAAETARGESEESTQRANGALHETATATARLEAEEQALAEILRTAEDDLWPPLIDAVSVDPGFETALGAALGEDLSVPADEAAPTHWRTLSPYPRLTPLPAGARPLAEVVNAPTALARRLAQVGFVETDAEAARLAGDLAQGQRLVSRNGGLWRWDGYTMSAEAASPAAIRLEQRNRLAEIRGKLDAARQTLHNAEAARETARQHEQQMRDKEREARNGVSEADRAGGAARLQLAAAKEQANAHSTRIGALSDSAAANAVDIEESEGQLRDATSELDSVADPAEDRTVIGGLRTEMAEQRSRQVECQSRHDNLERIARARGERLSDIATEMETWQRQRQAAARQLSELEQRSESLTAKLQRLSGLPAELDARRAALMDQIAESEARRNGAAEQLAAAENALRNAEQALREAEVKLAQARESRVRAEGAVEQGKQACQSITERVVERLDCRPAELFEIAELRQDQPLPEMEAAERKAERLIRERETMGPVNLRAEQEAEEMAEQISTLTLEKDDLLKAIDKLRRGISELNREGRARLLESFKEVDRHFQELFVRLFGGGRAHLALTDSDDPLDAGLEIMASPPGKKLQILSLLSGGEQALTALSLLFAVFLTNPAPICVLDEVDAPLDDANVDRFCTLLDEMAHSEKTRFLVITHHRMTMARMDRLYGVTMSERGVSQLVSVDLRAAEELRDIA